MLSNSFQNYLILSVVISLAYAHYHDDDGHYGEPTKTGWAPKNTAELAADFWKTKSQDALRAKIGKSLNTNVAKNIIFFLGDGLSVPTLAATRIYLGQRYGLTGEEVELSFEKFPAVGLTKTYCVNAQIADSACTATAYLAGIKNNRGTLGVTASVQRGDCPGSLIAENRVTSIADWAIKAGKDAGIVTTTRITHASPGGAFAKIGNRNWEADSIANADGVDTTVCPDIAKQLIREDPGNKFKVILGGGRRNFRNETVLDEEGDLGLRADGLDLIEEWQRDKIGKNASYNYAWNKNQLLNVDYENTDYLLGLFESDHLMYNLETNPETEPTLSELTEAAIKILSKNANGYFVFIEAGRIDHAHHNNWVHLALDETIELHKAVERAVELTDPEDTLIVVTADHAHVMAFNGYSVRGKDVAGPSDERGSDGVPYMTLSYTNGPGFQSHVREGVRTDPTTDNLYRETSFMYPAEVPLESETHGGDDVAVFAYGPHEHLFTGMYEQSDIPHLMAYASCIGDGLQLCSSANTIAASIMFIIISFVFTINNIN